MSISIHPSALKHGIPEEDILYAANWALWIEPLDEDNPQRELRLGFDATGRMLELVVLILIAGMSWSFMQRKHVRSAWICYPDFCFLNISRGFSSFETTASFAL